MNIKNTKCLILLLTAVGILTSCKNEELPPASDIVTEAGSELVEQTEAILSSEATLPDLSPVIENVDWSDYFQGLNGCAVIYMPDDNRYMIYNEKMSDIRRSPCSTFKIISSLCGIENGFISAGESERSWSGEIFWNDKWNRDIDFKDAFKTSCVWYFRELINDLGQDLIQEELDRLEYGNRDCTDWEGYLNNNNSNRKLTGFWIESSLKISPKEQVEVLERIFGERSIYQAETIALLEEVMLVNDSDLPNKQVYGKTGMGKTNGIAVDAWFTGYTEAENKKAYFCVYLGQTEGKEISSAEAKKIALRIIDDN